VEKVRWKLSLCIGLLICLLLPTVLANSEVSFTPTKNRIILEDKAIFKLKITNNGEEKARYSIFSFQSGNGWIVDPSPLKDKIIEIPAEQSYTTTIYAKPIEDFSPGIYFVSVRIENDKGEKFDEALKIYLASDIPRDYLPTFKVDVDMDDKISPTEPVSIKLFLDNRNPLDLNGLKVKIQSEIPEFNKELSVDLPPLDKKTVEFTITPSKHQQPKEYTLFFVFEQNDQQIKVVEEKFEIVTSLPEFINNIIEERSFLKTYGQITITNDGNVKNKQEIKIPITFWRSIFSSGEEDVKVIDGERYLVWELSLSSNQTITVNYVINYRTLLYLAIVIILLLSFYFYVHTPIVINKNAATTHSGQDGALSAIKITLEVRNKSKRPLKDINITDIIPGIANLEKSLELGTLRPKEVKHTKKGTSVKWGLVELDAHEHRLITYKIKAKLNILGTFSLPRAIVEYKKGKKKVGKAYSNVSKLGQ
jgi:hypothetical protein